MVTAVIELKRIDGKYEPNTRLEARIETPLTQCFDENIIAEMAIRDFYKKVEEQLKHVVKNYEKGFNIQFENMLP